MTKKRKHDPRSEAAMREAIKLWLKQDAELTVRHKQIGTCELEIEKNNETLAIFDLRDCYRKRQPLKGITKAVRKAVQPRRKKK